MIQQYKKSRLDTAFRKSYAVSLRPEDAEAFETFAEMVNKPRAQIIRDALLAYITTQETVPCVFDIINDTTEDTTNE